MLSPAQRENIATIIDALDATGDGAISRAELIDAMRQVFCNVDTPEAPGARVVR